MNRPRYSVGLDLGDGESAIAWVRCEGDARLRLYEHSPDEVSVVTALARSADGGHVIGESALRDPDARQVRINFKDRPQVSRVGLTPPSDAADFARLFLIGFSDRYPEVAGDCVIHVGHPTGWDEDTVAVYRDQLEGVLRPLDVVLVPESQSAFLHVHDEERADPRARPALVVDIGSSTTDFTLVSDIAENLPYGDGLGGRRIDEDIAEAVLSRIGGPSSRERERLTRPSAACVLLWLSRRHKEAQFQGLVGEPPPAAPDTELRWILDTCGPLLAQVPVTELVARPGGWRERFRAELERVRDDLENRPEALRPAVVLTTGGGSRMPFVGGVCAEVFPGTLIDPVSEPSLSVARGLASYGRWRSRVDNFREGVRELADSPALTDLVKRESKDMAGRLWDIWMNQNYDAIIKPVLDEIESGVDPRIAWQGPEHGTQRLIAWLDTPEGAAARERLLGPVERGVDRVLQSEAARLCEECGLPPRALSTRLTLAPTIVSRPRGKVLGALLRASEAFAPMMAFSLRVRPYRSMLRWSTQGNQWLSRKTPALNAFDARHRVFSDEDVAELTESIRREVGRQLLEQSRGIEALLA